MMNTSTESCTILVFWFSLLPILVLSTATDTMTMSQSIRDGETIVSAGGSFELGFFSPGNSTKRYLGIWYKKIPTITAVWVANREIPVLDKSGVLKVSKPGILVLFNGKGTTIWSSNTTRSVLNPVVKLLESGNLVVGNGKDGKQENFLWQSFDYPGNTLMPGMKHGRNTITGLDWYLSSWKSTEDPSKGNFTYQFDPRGYPQIFIKKGSIDLFRSGPWNGLRFSGTPGIKPNPIFTFHFVFNEEEMYFTYQLVNTSHISMIFLNPDGVFQRSVWIDRTQSWNVFRNAQSDDCDSYAFCGAYGSCNIDHSPICECLGGFVPKFPRDWDTADWSNGCVRRTRLDCGNGDGFVKYSGVKVPDTRHSWFNASMTLEECRMECLKNCSCMAYTNLDISKGGSGCLLWFGVLIDIRVFKENGQEIYIRMASSEIGKVGSNGEKREKTIAISLVLLAGMLLLGLSLTFYAWKKKRLCIKGKKGHNPERAYITDPEEEDLELPLYDLATVAKATNNFSINNKLGEGGFGPVYKGVLIEGKEIAVKMLSQCSKQGLDEFKNEVLCIAKLQHRNLVKLLGCCIEEKMLIYEYMPNKSLDFFIFDQTQTTLLNWHQRIQIIKGIARGLLYLHEDSRLRIIHRDLKASNILLDNEMNPKISDFGLARSFGGNETEANTTRVVGTYGYMPPEYVIDGVFSIKSDVFSFGVLVLEIVSGKKNRGFYHHDHKLNLLGHAWRLYKEGRFLELVDAMIEDSCNLHELLRSIHVGLLCVQRCPEDRPNMSSIVLMLASESELPQPKEPAFFAERNPLEKESSSSMQESCSIQESCSVNEITITMLAAR